MARDDGIERPTAAAVTLVLVVVGLLVRSPETTFRTLQGHTHNTPTADMPGVKVGGTEGRILATVTPSLLADAVVVSG